MASDISRNFAVSSSWVQSEGERTLQHRCRFYLDDLKSVRFDPDSVSVEECFMLRTPSEEENQACCRISFISKISGATLDKILIVSESRLVELYDSSSGEYYRSVPGVMSADSDEDIKMFETCIDLSDLRLDSCDLKLTGLKDSCWIMALIIGLSTSDPKHLSGSKQSFDIQEMNEKLNDTELSDRARNFKKLFESFQSPQPSDVGLSQNLSLLAGLSGMSNLPSASSLSLLMQQAPPSDKSQILSEFSNMPSNANTEKTFCESCSNCGNSGLLDLKLQDMEKRIITRIEKVERTQNEKLDKILNLLQKGETSKS